MKKALKIFSIINCIISALVLLMIIEPAVVGYDDGIGFLLMYINFMLSGVTLLFWVVFSIFQKNNVKLKVASILSLLIYVGGIVLFSGNHLLFLPLDVRLKLDWLIWILPFVLIVLLLLVGKNSLIVDKSKEK